MAGFQEVFVPTGTASTLASSLYKTLKRLGVPAFAIAGFAFATLLRIEMPDPSAAAMLGAGLTGLAILGTPRKSSD